MNVDDVEQILQNPAEIQRRGFDVLKFIATLMEEGSALIAQDLTLRALEFRADFGYLTIVLDSIVRQLGLFPYLSRDSLHTSDLIALEYHHPDNMGDIVFHRVQLARLSQISMGTCCRHGSAKRDSMQILCTSAWKCAT
jgi:hypothetical protein